jgi:hypothetical protein
MSILRAIFPAKHFWERTLMASDVTITQSEICIPFLENRLQSLQLLLQTIHRSTIDRFGP